MALNTISNVSTGLIDFYIIDFYIIDFYIIECHVEYLNLVVLQSQQPSSFLSFGSRSLFLLLPQMKCHSKLCISIVKMLCRHLYPVNFYITIPVPLLFFIFVL